MPRLRALENLKDFPFSTMFKGLSCHNLMFTCAYCCLRRYNKMHLILKKFVL